MTNIDRLYNKNAAKRFFGKDFFLDKKLGFQVIEQGTILPHKKWGMTERTNWIGFGGIEDNRGNLVKESFPLYGTLDPYKPTEETIKSSETVVYLGVFASNWGHFITIDLANLWFLTSDVFKKEFKKCPLVYLPWDELRTGYANLDQHKNFKRILEILEIDTDALRPITQPTQFDKIILPDGSFIAPDKWPPFFTAEYRETVDRIKHFALKNRTPTASNKVYYFHGRRQTGEERLAEYFKSKGYEIVQPEKLTFDEQLNLLINCDSFASSLGSISHNATFLRYGTETIYILRAAGHFTGYQQVIDQVHNLNANYIDSTLSIFGDVRKPTCYIISEQLKNFFGDKFDGYAKEDFSIFLDYFKRCLRKGYVINPRANVHYGKIFPDFEAQLLQQNKLLKKYRLNFVTSEIADATDVKSDVADDKVAVKDEPLTTNLDYLYNKAAVKNSFKRDYFSDAKLSFRTFENGIILPHETPEDCGWWGKGGIIDANGNFLRDSGAMDNKAPTPPANVKKSSDIAVYLGLFAPAWGHAFTVNFNRLWFLRSDTFKKYFKNCRLVYLPWLKNNRGDYQFLEQKKNFMHFLEILDIDPNALQPITEPTQFESIVLPDDSFSFAENGKLFFTEEYRETIERIRHFAQKNQTPTSNKKVYYFYGKHQTGEEKLSEYFASKGYAVVRPETLTLDEQLNLLINCDSFASTLGSCSHNSVFLRDGAEAILIPRAAGQFTIYQRALDQIHPLNVNYVDSTLSVCGRLHAGYCYIVSEQLKKFFGDDFKGYSRNDFKIFLKHIQSSIRKGRNFTPKAAKYYGKILPDFLAQLHRNEKLIRAYKLPENWEQILS